MRKKSNKMPFIVLLLAFIIGLLLFLFPVISELTSYQADEEEYEDMARQFQSPDPSPKIVFIICTKEPTREPSAASSPPPLTPEPSLPVSPDEGETHNTVEAAVTPTIQVQNPTITDFPSTPAPDPSPEGTDTFNATATPNVTATSQPTREPKALTADKTPLGVRETFQPDTVWIESTKSTFSPAPAATSVPRQASVDLDACLRQNKDFVAWLTIPGTKINYPVVRSNNTEYYLVHMFSGKESKLGSLFSLKSSDYRTPSKNIAIYGHHLSQSDAMFSTLMEYKKASYCASHSRIRLETLYGTREYRIFAVLNINVSDWDAATASFSNNESFLRFVNRAIKKSMFDTGVRVEETDNILTLITCDRSYGGASGRLIVMAVQE